MSASHAAKAGRLRRVAHASLGLLLLASGVATLLQAGTATLRVSLWSFDVPLHVLAAIGELVVAALLLLPRPTRTTGAALLAWSLGTLVIREQVFQGEDCGCMSGLGLGPRAVLLVWGLVTLLGALALVRGGASERSWLQPVQSASAIAMLLGALVAAEELAAPGGPLHVAIQWEDADSSSGRESARLVVMNTSTSDIDGVKLEASCSCVRLGEVPASVGAGDTAVVEIALVDRAPGTVPLVMLHGSVDGRPVRSRAFLSRVEQP